MALVAHLFSQSTLLLLRVGASARARGGVWQQKRAAEVSYLGLVQLVFFLFCFVLFICFVWPRGRGRGRGSRDLTMGIGNGFLLTKFSAVVVLRYSRDRCIFTWVSQTRLMKPVSFPPCLTDYVLRNRENKVSQFFWRLRLSYAGSKEDNRSDDLLISFVECVWRHPWIPKSRAMWGPSKCVHFLDCIEVAPRHHPEDSIHRWYSDSKLPLMDTGQVVTKL
jgi:hypothetical protein